MSFVRNVTRGLRSLFHGEKGDRALDEELRAYLQMATEDSSEPPVVPLRTVCEQFFTQANSTCQNQKS